MRQSPAIQDRVDATPLIEGQRLSWFLVELILLSWVITFLDGLDGNLISFASPYFAEEFGLNTIQTGNVFSAHMAGTLIGGFLLAYIGDIIGRRPAIILATAAFGILTSAFILVYDYPSLLLLRFLDGIPLGGVLPLAWALNIEYVPKRYRATVVTVTMIGYSVGAASGGPLANALAPSFGWRSIFLMGGATALLVAVVLLARLPESIRFMIGKARPSQQIGAVLRRLDPRWHLESNTQYRLSDEQGHAANFRPAMLFRGRLRVITPLVWTAFIASSFAVFFLVNWTPLVFESLGYSRSDAAVAAALNSLVGAFAGVCLMRFTDRFGAIAITVMPVASCLLLLIAGFADMSQAAFFVLAASIGGFLIGGHFGILSVAGVFYPTAYRGNGLGWAASIAKIGSIAGPLVGGWVLSTSLPVRHIYAALAVCPIVFALCVYQLGKIHREILGHESAALPRGAN